MCTFDQNGYYVECADSARHQHAWNGYPTLGLAGGRQIAPDPRVMDREAYQNVFAGVGAEAYTAVYPQAPLPERPGWQPVGPTAPDPFDPRAAHSWPLHTTATARPIERLAGVSMTHEEQFWQQRNCFFTPAAGLGAGALVQDEFSLRFYAKSLICDNPTSYVLLETHSQRYIPNNVFGYIIRPYPAINHLRIVVSSGALSPGGQCVIQATEEPLKAG